MVPQVGYQHVSWAHQATNPNREKLGTWDDLFVRKDVTLLRGGKEEL